MHVGGVRRCAVLLPTAHAVLLGVHHVTTSVCTSRDSTCISNSFVDDVPPSARSVVESICRLFHPSSNVRRISCFWRESTDNVSIVVIVFSLEEGCLEVDVIERKMVIGTKLAGQTKARATGCWAVCLLLVLLAILEPHSRPIGPCTCRRFRLSSS